MYISEFCKLTAVTPKTIRLYERIGLLPAAMRKGNYHVYDTTYVETVKQIKAAQQFGFTLAELKQLCAGGWVLTVQSRGMQTVSIQWLRFCLNLLLITNNRMKESPLV